MRHSFTTRKWCRCYLLSHWPTITNNCSQFSFSIQTMFYLAPHFRSIFITISISTWFLFIHIYKIKVEQKLYFCFNLMFTYWLFFSLLTITRSAQIDSTSFLSLSMLDHLPHKKFHLDFSLELYFILGSNKGKWVHLYIEKWRLLKYQTISNECFPKATAD